MKIVINNLILFYLVLKWLYRDEYAFIVRILFLDVNLTDFIFIYSECYSS